MNQKAPLGDSVEDVLDALRYENDKLRKINQVLIQRVEQGWGNQGDAYRSFQNAALLEDKVKDRTIKLRRTLYKLEEANQTLSETRRESAHTRQRLYDTIESISDAIVLFDSERRLVLANSQFYDFWRGTDARIETGVTRFRDLAPMAVRHGIYDPRRKPFEKLVQRGTSSRDSVIRLADGRWLQVSERPTAEDGLVVAYSDITALKQHEIARQEQVLAEQNRILQSMIDNLPLGVALVSRRGELEAWNGRFLDLTAADRSRIAHGASIAEVLADSPLLTASVGAEPEGSTGQPLMIETEELLENGRAIAVKRHGIPGGGYVTTYQDITTQRRTSEALKNAYKHMEQRVHERTGELTALNHQLRVEIEERGLAEKNLLEAKREAEQANVSKTKFLAAASHDLLQPLNAARLFVTALLDKELPEQERRLAQSLSYSLTDVETLLGTLVDISKLEAGIVEPVLDHFLINDLLRNLANEFEQQASRAGLGFRFVPCQLTVHSDSQLLARILRNFLTNAIRYTDSGRLLLGCRRRGDQLEIQVWDTGVGIPADQMQEIFEEFKRINPVSKREEKGLGLGLAIVDKLSRVLDHEVRVASRPGAGSVFSVCVPLGTSPSADTSPASRWGASLETPLAGRSVLVLDNEQAICDGMALVLEGWGCEVVTACTVEDVQALPGLADDPPDLLILDYHLDDGVTGLEAEQEIRKLLGHKVPCLMITADYGNALRQELKALGFLLLNKPIKPLKLKSVLAYMLKELP